MTRWVLVSFGFDLLACIAGAETAFLLQHKGWGYQLPGNRIRVLSRALRSQHGSRLSGMIRIQAIHQGMGKQANEEEVSVD